MAETEAGVVDMAHCMRHGGTFEAAVGRQNCSTSTHQQGSGSVSREKAIQKGFARRPFTPKRFGVYGPFGGCFSSSFRLFSGGVLGTFLGPFLTFFRPFLGPFLAFFGPRILTKKRRNPIFRPERYVANVVFQTVCNCCGDLPPSGCSERSPNWPKVPLKT